MKKLLIVQVAGLGHNFATQQGCTAVADLPLRAMRSIFPALTCTAQATIRTGLAPAAHGMVANGFYEAVHRRPRFWEQSARLVAGARLWEGFRQRGGTVGVTFFQQSLGEDVEWLLSPAPIHTHGGGMIMGCYSKPESLFPKMRAATGRAFHLWQYWGPLASPKSSAWIAAAIADALAWPDAPDLLLTYLPGLDYDLQRYGPNHPKSAAAMRAVRQQIEQLLQAARLNGYEAIIYGDYSITPVTHGAIHPNRALRKAGLFKLRQVRHMTYPDFYQSRAFAVVDHQVALVTCGAPADIAPTCALLESLDGVDQVLDRQAQAAVGVAHEHAGDLLLVAKPGAWFAWPWWDNQREAPDYATHVDIHNKPGFDPCELFFGRTPFSTCQDASRIKGTHGRADATCDTALYTTIPCQATTLPELSENIRAWLNN